MKIHFLHYIMRPVQAVNQQAKYIKLIKGLNTSIANFPNTLPFLISLTLFRATLQRLICHIILIFFGQEKQTSYRTRCRRFTCIPTLALPSLLYIRVEQLTINKGVLHFLDRNGEEYEADNKLRTSYLRFPRGLCME